MKRNFKTVILFAVSIAGILASLGCFVLAFMTKSWYNLGYILYFIVGIAFFFNYDNFEMVILGFVVSFLISAFLNVFIFDFSWLGIILISFVQNLLFPCMGGLIVKAYDLF